MSFDTSSWFGNPDEQQGYLEVDALRQAQQMQALRRADAEVERTNLYLESLGEDPITEPKKGLFSSLMDTLSYPREVAQGVGAKILGVGDYGKLSFGEAIDKATEDHLSGGKLLRENQFFRKHSILRGLAGFGLDITTDPLNWVSAAATGTKIGGSAISDAFFDTKDGSKTLLSIAQANEANHYKDILNNLKDQYKTVLDGVDQLPDFLTAEARTQAAVQAARPFEFANALNQVRKKMERTGISDIEQLAGAKSEAANTLREYFKTHIGVDAVPASDWISQGEQIVAEQLGFKDPDSVRRMFKKPAIRLSSPLAGIGPLGRVPVLGAAETDIPFITPLTEQLFEGLNGGYYGAKIAVSNAVSKGLENDPNSLAWNAIDRIGQALTKGTTKIGSLISRRVQATGQLIGPQGPLNDIKEHERTLGLLFNNELQKATFAFRHLIPEDNFQELMQSIPDLFPEGLDKIEGARAFEANLGQAIQKWNATGQITKSGKRLGDAMEEAIRYSRQNMGTIGGLLEQKGLINSAIDNYIPHMYTAAEGIEDVNSPAFKAVKNLIGGQDFTMERTIQSMKEAPLHNLTPNKNFFHVLVGYNYAAQKAIAEQEFAERLAYQWALPKPVYEKLTQMGQEVSNQERLKAIDGLRRFGTPIEPITLTNNQLITPENYAKMKEVALSGDKDPLWGVLQTQLKEFERNGIRLTFDNPEEEQKILKMFNEASVSDGYLLGRRGESTFARAGGRTLPDAIKKQFKNMTPEDRIFWDGVIPDNLAKAVEDSYDTRNLVQDIAHRLRKAGRNPESSVMYRLAKSFGSLHKNFKFGATQLWPGYWVGNLGSSQIQGIQAASALGTAFNPVKMFNYNEAILNDGVLPMAKGGGSISGKQFLNEFAKAGIDNRHMAIYDILDDFSTVLDHLSVSEAIDKQLPQLKQLGESFKQSTSEGLIDRGWNTYKTMASRLEAFGRRHLYMDLRLNGWDPNSAANEVNRLLIDYAHGKTPFERKFLNNLFFFYSFTRGQASNNLISMMTKPGVLSTQLSTHRAIAEMLTNPDNLEGNDRDIEDTIRSTRMGEQLTTYLGNNPETGGAMVLSGTRLPMEDLGRWLSVQMPEKLTVKDVMNAGFESASRTARLTMAQTNPIVRGFLERLVFKKDLFFDRPITDETLRRIPKLSRFLNTVAPYPINAIPKSIYETVDDWTKNLLGGRDNGDGTMTVSPASMAVLTYVVPTLGTLADTNNKYLSLARITSGLPRAINEAKRITDPASSGGQKALNFLTGANVFEVDPEASKTYDLRERQRALMGQHSIAQGKLNRLIQDSFNDEE